MSTSANNWYSRLYLEQHPIISLNDEESQLFCQYYNLLNSKLTGTPHRHQKELINALLQAFIYEFQDSMEKYIQLKPGRIQFVQQSVQCLHGTADIFLPQRNGR